MTFARLLAIAIALHAVGCSDASGLDEHHLGVKCTLTAGIASFPHPGVHKPEDMFALVERALLAGKAQEGERIGSAA